MQANDSILYYIHDPMCSWCWAFRPVWKQFETQLEQHFSTAMRIEYLLGGLAPDSDVLMPASMQQQIQQHWHAIEQRVGGTQFNFDFWTQCKPRRSTYPACRAVIAARQQGLLYEKTMILAVQQAYYLHARNPSDAAILMDLAVDMGLNQDQFYADLHSPETQVRLCQEIRQSRQLWQRSGAGGFPSLVLLWGEHCHAIAIDYHHVDKMLEQLAGFRQ